MEETRDASGPAGQGASNAVWWASDITEKLGSVSLASQEETFNNRGSPKNPGVNELPSQTASQILWSTGMLSDPIPNGFYSVIPERRFKELFDTIPTVDELHSLGVEGLKADVILVDAAKDKKLIMLKQLIVTLAKGLNSNPPAMIKKIASVISDVYKRPNVESPARIVLEENSLLFENRDVQMLGQIKHGSCRPRALLFKVLADTIGLESKLVVGLPNDGTLECIDPYKHMSVVVMLNSTELLVDLMRFPGQLIPLSTRAMLMTHISASGESDSAENDSCDSPLEPNSPMCGFADRLDPESAEKDENLQFRKKEALNVSGPAFRNMMLQPTTSLERKLSASHSEPNIATTFWRRSRRKVIAEQRTASSSPEHPSFQARRRSMLGGDQKQLRDYSDDVATSSYKSEGASKSETRRLRRRSISITPEIGDDIVRAVRAMNETLKQNRLLREQGNDSSFSHSTNERSSGSDKINETNFDPHGRDELSGGSSVLYNRRREQFNSQKAVSLPTSPHEHRNRNSEELVSTWNKVLESLTFNGRLLPYQEWHIDFSELTVGTRVGIGFFGEVFRGIWNGTDVAIKVFLEQDLTAENMEDFCNEISILSNFISRRMHEASSVVNGYRIYGEGIVILFDSREWSEEEAQLAEETKNVARYMQKKKDENALDPDLKKIPGLMCMHRMKITHRDLKSANCLVNENWTVKICDFGLSRIMTEYPMKDNSSAGTPEWMAPELIRSEPFTEKCDIFSFGVIMWELCTLSRPWEGVPPEKVVYAVANEGARLDIPDGPLGKLISDCWAAEAQERPSCNDILTRLLECEYTMC